ncbi:MAG: BON domain-containing protein [Bacteroidales bacterium]
MFALGRLIFTLLLLIVVGGAGYYFGYQAGAGRAPALLPNQLLHGEIGTTGSKAAAQAREEGGDIGRKLAAAGSEATEFLSDAALTTKIKSKMGLDDTLASGDIHVSTTNAVVTLSGTVTDSAQRQRAAQLARETKGVKSVVDKLQLQR